MRVLSIENIKRRRIDMGTIIAVGMAGAIGSILRFILSVRVQSLTNSSFPFGIFSVNVIGCFLIGFLATFFLERMEVLPIWRAAVLIGFLGGFTTFSAFTNDSISLIESGEFFMAISYIFLTLILCLLVTWIGVWLARSI